MSVQKPCLWYESWRGNLQTIYCTCHLTRVWIFCDDIVCALWFMYGLLKENVSCINPSLVLSFVPFSFWKIRGDNRFIKYLHLYLWIFISSYRYFDRGLHRFLVRLVCPFLKQPFMIVYSILLNCAHNKKIPNNDFLVDQTKMAFWLSPLKMQCILTNLSFTFILLHKC